MALAEYFHRKLLLAAATNDADENSEFKVYETIVLYRKLISSGKDKAGCHVQKHNFSVVSLPVAPMSPLTILCSRKGAADIVYAPALHVTKKLQSLITINSH